MANQEDPKKGQDFFQIFTKAKEFTEELLKENERLRFKIARLESGEPAGSNEHVNELQHRVRELEQRLAELSERYKKVEERFQLRYEVKAG